MIYGKVWGSTEPIFNKNNISVNRICVNTDGYSSAHYHDHKFNMFYVERGKLKIMVWKDKYGLVDETILNSGDSTIVAPGEKHKFACLEETIAYEIYWTELQEDDIKRDDCGGVNEYKDI